MNEVIRAITSRRSIREFLPKPVTDEDLATILECGLRAPSSKNSNPWFFVVTRGEEKDAIASWVEDGAKQSQAAKGPIDAKTGKMATGAFDSTTESVRTIRQASVLILFFNRAPMSGGKEYVIENPRNGRSLYTYAGEVIGIGAAAQNMLLAAHSLGLGAVYMADSYPGRVAVQKALQTDREMLGSLAIGYPAYSKPPRKVFPELVATWDQVKTNGIRSENFTAGRTDE